jgi:hypothetical protein
MRERLSETLYRLEGAVYCAGCDRMLGPATGNPRRYCLVRRRELAAAGPWLALRWGGRSPNFELVEFICPHCGVLVDALERRRGEDTLWENTVEPAGG